MPRLSRRSFVTWLGALAAALGLKKRQAWASESQPAAASLPFPALVALAEAVLPSELGKAGLESAAREFARWVAEYRDGAELLHPYGSDRIGAAPALPRRTWREQLTTLDREARRLNRAPFAQLPAAVRQDVVRAALAGVTVRGMPSVETAPHVALALMAHYYGTPGATDRCYGVQIGPNQCRPLVHNPRQPLPLANGGRA